MGGVTNLKFAPNGRLLFSGSRKDAAIVCWDIRRTKEVREILVGMLQPQCGVTATANYAEHGGPYMPLKHMRVDLFIKKLF